MYYEEKIVNDVLCTRGTPDGEFIPLSQVALTSRISALRAERDEAVDKLKTANAALILLSKEKGFTPAMAGFVASVRDFLARFHND